MMELIKVEDLGATVHVTLKLNKRLAGYLIGILDSLLGIARQLHWKAKCAAASRRALDQIHRIDGDPRAILKIRDEMILYLKEAGWKMKDIAAVYELTPANVRQILHRQKKITS